MSKLASGAVTWGGEGARAISRLILWCSKKLSMSLIPIVSFVCEPEVGDLPTGDYFIDFSNGFRLRRLIGPFLGDFVGGHRPELQKLYERTMPMVPEGKCAHVVPSDYPNMIVKLYKDVIRIETL